MAGSSTVIRTPDQRLRVFVSSTMRELEGERVAAIEAIQSLKLTAVLFELGARPHPPRRLYEAYLEQSHVFVGIYGEEYGWIAPGMEISGLEDEFLLWGDRPALIYIKEPAPDRDERLKALLRRIEESDRACYKRFSSADDLRTMIADDLAVLLSERFETASVAPAGSVISAPVTHERPRVHRLRLKIGLAVMAAALAIAIGFSVSARREPRNASESDPAGAEAAVPESTSIAVLPFVNMSPDPTQEYFSDGLAEELLNVLSNVPELRVISRTSSFQFKGKNEDMRTIGRKLNAAHVLEGSVRKSGDRVRITAQLVATATGSHLWSRTYDRNLKDIFEVQTDIARSVANASRVTLLGSDGGSSAQYGNNAEAYSLFLQAKYFSRRGSRESLEQATAYYDQALKLDPGRGVYWAGLAGVRIRQVGHGFVDEEDGVRESRENLMKALDLDPTLAEAHALLGWIRLTHDWDWERAALSSERALKYGPGSAMVVGNAASLAAALGRFEQSIQLNRRAIRLDPLNVAPLFNLSQAALAVDRFDEAEAALRRVFELSPEQPAAHAALGVAYLLQGRPDAAVEEIRKETLASDRRQGLALAYYALRRHHDADSALAELLQNDGESGAFRIAQVYAYRRDPDRAFEWLERAFAQHDPDVAFVKGEPLLRNLETDPRYRAFLLKMRLPS